jgi:uncharacterized SAM-dependent methyltransferase
MSLHTCAPTSGELVTYLVIIARQGAICPETSLIRYAEGYKHVKCFGLYGTYDDALEWLKTPEIEAKPKTILWLGSSLGNFKRHEVPPFLAGFGAALQTGDTMLIGIDSCKDPEVHISFP